MSAARIRDARREDIAAIVAILAEDSRGAACERPGEPLAPGYLDGFAAAAEDPNTHLIVAERDGDVVGFMQMHLSRGLTREGASRLTLESVFVAGRSQGAGVGTVLLRWALDFAAARGCTTVQLTSHKSRTRAHAFYQRLGFEASHVGFKYQVPR
jgi:GNAT superfamily N-acetyltransferase